MKNKLILITIFLLLLGIPALAADQEDATPSSTVEEIQKSLQERIKKAIQGDQKEGQPTLKAFVGQVSTIADNTITISSGDEVKHTTISGDTEIVRSSSKVKPESIKISEGIIAMGLTSDFQTQQALRIVLFETLAPKSVRSVSLGSLTSIDLKKEELTLTPYGSTTPLTLNLTSKTLFLDNDYKAIKIDKLEEQVMAIAILSTNQQNQSQTLLKLILVNEASKPSPTTKSSCGDGVCQNIVCQGIGCPKPETPETCPIDCTQ